MCGTTVTSMLADRRANVPAAALKPRAGAGTQTIRGQHKGLVASHRNIATRSEEFREVNYTAQHCQLVVMPLKLYTIYSPPNHRDGVVHHTRADADADTEHFGPRPRRPRGGTSVRVPVVCVREVRVRVLQRQVTMAV